MTEEEDINEEQSAKNAEKPVKNAGYEIHIGKTLRKLLRRKSLSTKELGDMIGLDDSSVSRMLRKKYLHSKVMLDISSALSHDLFQYLYQPGEWPANKALQKKVEKLEHENGELKKELQYLKEINEMLKNK